MDRSAVVSNMLWRYAERFGAQLIAFIVTIILGRILVPEDYGLIALVTVIIAVLNVFVDSGLNTALIQKKDADTPISRASSASTSQSAWCSTSPSSSPPRS